MEVLLKQILEEIKEMKTDIKDMKTDIKDMKMDIKDTKTDIKDMKTDIKDMKTDIKDAKTDIKDAKTDIKDLKTQVTENTQILKALENCAEINKSEHDKIINDIAHMNGNVEAIKKDLSQVELVTANNWADIVRLKAVK